MVAHEGPRTVRLDDESKRKQARTAEAGVSDGLNAMASLILDTLHGTSRTAEPLKSCAVIFGSQNVYVVTDSHCGAYDSEAMVCRECTPEEIQTIEALQQMGGGVPI